jgi:hypothetical protein
MDASTLGILQGFPSAIDVYLEQPAEPANNWTLDVLRDGFHRLEIAL